MLHHLPAAPPQIRRTALPYRSLMGSFWMLNASVYRHDTANTTYTECHQLLTPKKRMLAIPSLTVYRRITAKCWFQFMRFTYKHKLEQNTCRMRVIVIFNHAFNKRSVSSTPTFWQWCFLPASNQYCDPSFLEHVQ